MLSDGLSGYSFNFALYWSRLRAGDMRLTY